ncbi:MAG TPA: histidine kinase [Candidatus Limnocylindrales bacterium]|nr:histidine kinase [Candidatus Limnocylindrales bacterium]
MRGSSVRIGLVVLVAIVASVISIAATVARVAAPSTGTAFVATRDAAARGGVEVDPLPGSSSPVAPREVVVGVDGVRLDAVPATIGASAAPATGAEHVAFDVLRDGQLLRLEVPLGPYPLVATVIGSAGTLAFCVLLFGVATFVMWRRPADPAAGALLLTGVGALGSTVPFLLGLDPLDLLTGAWTVHLAAIGGVYMLLWAGAIHFALVFPRPVPALARRPLLELVPYAVVFGLAALNVGIAWLTSTSAVGFFASYSTLQLGIVAGSIVTSALMTAVRWRRSGPADRRLLGAFLAAGAFSVAVNIVVWVVPEAIAGRPLLPWSVAGIVGVPVPLALGSAILRHRAFDIDVVVRRSLLWGTLSAGVVVTYAGAVTILGRVFDAQEPFATSLLATGLAAVLVLPLRDVVQRTIDRALYGDRDDPVRAIRRLGSRLEGTLEPGAIPGVIVDTVADALRLPFVALELGTPGDERPVARRGETAGPELALPLVHQTQPVGRLLVSGRQADEPLSAADRALLDDLARQIGAAAHAVLLTEDLRRSRERIVTAREEERRRLHRDLHDGLGPSLAAIAMRAEAAATLVHTDPERAEPALLELAADVREGVSEVRRLVDGLRPPVLDELGLAGAIRREAGRLGEASGSMEVIVEAAALGELPAAVEVAAYRIAAEAMTNAARHARARRCVVRIRADGELKLEIADDGTGLGGGGASTTGTGLRSMAERAAELGGELRVESPPSAGTRGTRVIARLPLANPPAVAT